MTAVGSPNETVPGLAGNYEELTVHRSWMDAQGYVARHIQSYEEIWTGRKDGALAQIATIEVRSREAAAERARTKEKEKKAEKKTDKK